MTIEAIRTGEDEQAVRARLGQIIEAVNDVANTTSIAAIDAVGGTLSIPAGTLQDALQALADAIDPAA